ncbi:MAG: hypothetical protein JW929_11025 [Anaerolineales bacterium]|nr:hypothetical protein [Anaerolineales bacterium]
MKRQVGEFLDLPFSLYRGCPQWVPPLAADARSMLDRKRHPFYRHSDAAFFLADDGGRRAVGRIAVLDNRHYNEYNRERTAFFYLFECRDDSAAAKALFHAAADWARARGLNRLWGPKGFTSLDGMGLLVRGFEHRPALGIPYNFPYYPKLMEESGFRGTADVVSGYFNRSAQLPEHIHKMAEIVRRRRGLRILQFRSRRDLAKVVPRLQKLYNDSLAGTTGNTPLTDDEAKAMADQILWFADPHLIKLIAKGDELVGFVFAYPDISAALQRTRGRLFPFGWIDLLLELRRTKWVNLNGAGIVDKYRGLGGTAILFDEMAKSLQAGNFEHADVVQVGVENDKMQRELRGLGFDFYKTHRMYEKAI